MRLGIRLANLQLSDSNTDPFSWLDGREMPVMMTSAIHVLADR